MHVLNVLQMIFGIDLMLILNLKFKISSMATLLVATLSAGIPTDMDLMSLLRIMEASFGNTLGGLVIIVMFGVVIGKLMVDSDAAHQVAYALLARLGLRYIQLPVIIISPIFGLAMFCEVAFIMLAPPVITIAAEAKTPFLKLMIPAVIATATAHSLFPSQPGPMALVNACGADMGMVYIYGVLMTVLSVICAGLILPKFLGNLECLTPSFLRTDQPVGINNLPSFGVSILVPLIPAIIIISTTIANIWLVEGALIWEVVDPIDFSPIAMPIAVVVTSVLFDTTCGHNVQQAVDIFESAVKSIAVVILVIGADDVLKQTIVDTGIGDTIGMLVSRGNTSSYIMAWLIIMLIRLVTGQGVVSTMTAAGIISVTILDPVTGQLVGVSPALLVLTTAVSSNILIHINDASFWLFEGYFDLSVKDALKT